jgi:hypothetical protein
VAGGSRPPVRRKAAMRSSWPSSAQRVPAVCVLPAVAWSAGRSAGQFRGGPGADRKQAGQLAVPATPRSAVARRDPDRPMTAQRGRDGSPRRRDQRLVLARTGARDAPAWTGRVRTEVVHVLGEGSCALCRSLVRCGQVSGGHQEHSGRDSFGMRDEHRPASLFWIRSRVEVSGRRNDRLMTSVPAHQGAASHAWCHPSAARACPPRAVRRR